MINLKVGTGTGGQSTSAIPQSNAVIIADLTAATNKTVTIPTNATTVIFQHYGVDELYAKMGGTAFSAVPVASDTPQELMVNPDVRSITPGSTQIHLICKSGGKCVLNFYGG